MGKFECALATWQKFSGTQVGLLAAHFLEK
jgi:hypothetical protein